MVNYTSDSQAQQLYLATNSRDSSPRPSSAFEDFTLFDATDDSRRSSGAFNHSSASSPRSTMASHPPTLTEILLDAAPPPFTLSAFTAFLSQNHCMETLEFTLDRQRYAAVYDQTLQTYHPAHPAYPTAIANLCDLWDRLMQVYIAPCSAREVNIPSRVRDRLLGCVARPEPPHPRELDEAGRIIHELMNDSLLVPFLESASLADPSAAAAAGHTSPGSYSPYLQGGPGSSRSASVHAFDHDGLMTDDSDANSPPAMEPMTPPTTPPTPTDGPSSAGGFQRAMAAHSKGWKKVGAKLGFNRRPSTQQRTPPTSSVPMDDDAIARDGIHPPL